MLYAIIFTNTPQAAKLDPKLLHHAVTSKRIVYHSLLRRTGHVTSNQTIRSVNPP